MFEASRTPRVFGLPPGADFARALIGGLEARLSGQPPEAWARVTLLVNTRRMQRRLREVFDAGPPRALPRIRLITDIAHDPSASGLPPAVPALRRQLEIAQLIRGLIASEPDLAPRSAVFDLAASLVRLMDEMHGEGVSPQDIASLDVSDESGHWARALAFFKIVERYFGTLPHAPGIEERQRAAIEGLARRWAEAPPADPIILAGSTGSRGATALLMEAVSRLPQGAVVLPGFDFDMPTHVWDQLDDALTGEDHPQFRFRRLMSALDLRPGDIGPWHEAATDAARRRLVSLSLRPAPVTDAWLSEGPKLGDMLTATAGITYLEAPSPRLEAETIALFMRHAIEDGKTVVLISPDRMLGRQVSAALDRWGIVADDSAGQPLSLSAPGRLLRQIARMMGRKPAPDAILSLLKHPLCARPQPDGDEDQRGPHLLRTRELELYLRRHGAAYPDRATLNHWAERTAEHDPGRLAWADWLARILEMLTTPNGAVLETLHEQALALAAIVAAGPSGTAFGTLWDQAAGRAARAAFDDISRSADAGGEMSPADYAALVDNVLAAGSVRDRDEPHPGVLILGTLEARVLSVDVAILGSMNEGAWPEMPAPDPWLNRRMRKAAGLLLPDRRIGLLAHDYMQAVNAPAVWITRAVRDGEAQTVPSRWVNRLLNLVGGLPDQKGDEAVRAMRQRADKWLATAEARSNVAPIDTAKRPSPRPPVAHRPTELPVTAIGDLIRDPYMVYAQRILRLRKLNPLSPEPDARLRGTVTHKIVESFLSSGPDMADPLAKAAFLEIAEAVLDQECPWPSTRLLWLARLEGVADWFLSTELIRHAQGTPTRFEVSGEATLSEPPFKLTAKADRIDLTDTGQAIIYDYKTGEPPTVPQQKVFDKQLLLEAAIAVFGRYGELAPTGVAAAAYIGLGRKPKEVPAPLEEVPPEIVWQEFAKLMSAWRDRGRGYTAKMALENMEYEGDYDHLSRYGEWDSASDWHGEDVG